MVAPLMLPLLSALHLGQLVFKNDSLVYQGLVGGGVGNSKLNRQFVVQTIQEPFSALGIGVHIIRGIAGQLVEHLNVFCHSAASLSQLVEFLLLQA